MKRFGWIFILGILVFLFFFFFQANGNYNGDSGDLVVAAYQFGVPHPPGYPLYTFLAWLFTHLPYGTIAWRVGLLSNVAHTLTICFVVGSVYVLTKNKAASLLSALLLIGNYVFFLYAVTAEVFGLFSLFVSLIVLLFLQWLKTKKLIYWYIAFFVYGLSLSHHHVILFLFPAIAFLWWKERVLLSKKNLFLSVIIACVGLLPYSYIFIAAKGSAIVNWNHADTLDGFIKLVSRAYYGTFQSGNTYGETLYQRLLQLKAFFQFYIKDIGIFGILLGSIGIFSLRCKKQIFRFFCIGFFCIGPFFLFYASFPLLGYFSLATYERFLLPSYVLFTIAAGVGCHNLLTALDRVFQNRLSVLPRKLFVVGGMCIIIGMSSLGTIYKFIGFANDTTADRLGYDYLQSLEANAILFLSFDTSLFTTQYMRFAKNIRPDVVVLHADRITQPEYKKAIQKHFPHLTIPNIQEATTQTEFITANKFLPIYSNTRPQIPEGYVWVPYGLVFRFEAANKLTELDPIIEENKRLWSLYQNPNAGILSRHTHMMLADIPNTYARSRLEYGKILLKADRPDLAKEQFAQAVFLNGDSTIAESLKQLAIAQLLLKECETIFETFAKLIVYEPFVPHDAYYYQSIAYRDCMNDDNKAQQSLEIYRKKREKIQTTLSTF